MAKLPRFDTTATPVRQAQAPSVTVPQAQTFDLKPAFDLIGQFSQDVRDMEVQNALAGTRNELYTGLEDILQQGGEDMLDKALDLTNTVQATQLQKFQGNPAQQAQYQRQMGPAINSLLRGVVNAAQTQFQAQNQRQVSTTRDQLQQGIQIGEFLSPTGELKYGTMADQLNQAYVRPDGSIRVGLEGMMRGPSGNIGDSNYTMDVQELTTFANSQQWYDPANIDQTLAHTMDGTLEVTLPMFDEQGMWQGQVQTVELRHLTDRAVQASLRQQILQTVTQQYGMADLERKQAMARLEQRDFNIINGIQRYMTSTNTSFSDLPDQWMELYNGLSITKKSQFQTWLTKRRTNEEEGLVPQFITQPKNLFWKIQTQLSMMSVDEELETRNNLSTHVFEIDGDEVTLQDLPIPLQQKLINTNASRRTALQSARGQQLKDHELRIAKALRMNPSATILTKTESEALRLQETQIQATWHEGVQRIIDEFNRTNDGKTAETALQKLAQMVTGSITRARMEHLRTLGKLDKLFDAMMPMVEFQLQGLLDQEYFHYDPQSKSFTYQKGMEKAETHILTATSNVGGEQTFNEDSIRKLQAILGEHHIPSDNIGMTMLSQFFRYFDLLKRMP